MTTVALLGYIVRAWFIEEDISDHRALTHVIFVVFLVEEVHPAKAKMLINTYPHPRP